MEWRVVKMGVEQFDILHAYGLGILVATATGEPVELREWGCYYSLSCPAAQLPRVSCSALLERTLIICTGPGGVFWVPSAAERPIRAVESRSRCSGKLVFT